MSKPFRPRAWPLAAVAGAYAVIVPAALVASWSMMAFAHNMASAPAGSPAHADPRWLAEAIATASRIGGGIFLAGTVIGVPVAMLLAGSMTWLERRSPECGRLVAWLAGSLVAVLPVVIFSAAFTGLPVFVLPLFACALVGAAVAWTVRHRPFAR